jgi:hypothetical protein
MSFSLSFGAKSVQSARHKLNNEYAYVPASVKALIEKALDAIPLPVPEPLPSLASGRDATGGESAVGRITYADKVAGSGQSVNAKQHEPILVGVLVECEGHIANPGDSWPHSQINKFLVRPFYE